MKKYLILVCALLMISTVVQACGGITIKGNSGASYCLSKHTMNWYSAYAWCEAQGMKLLEMGPICKSYNSCAELKLSAEEQDRIINNGGQVGWVWTYPLTNPVHCAPVQLKTGGTNYTSCHELGCKGYALCF